MTHSFASGYAMTDSSKMSSLKASMNYARLIRSNYVQTETPSTVDPTVRDVERFWHWSVFERIIPTFQFGLQKILTNTSKKYLEFTKKKARAHVEIRLVNNYSLKSR